jgi:hypothetical protein
MSKYTSNTSQFPDVGTSNQRQIRGKDSQRPKNDKFSKAVTKEKRDEYREFQSQNGTLRAER